mmetsp:Transcript_17956/g.50636  ORF Transcript_17956/g.50636 Transcript_17956/m.50636 type:complete len:210 (-) Transcript_17956:66-695(-)|eukprot:CAMPEP_0119130256 /NCGR_PEP_ID=MMETSP1310-20130426/7664_1 /TAXON_ID=464262 /ORGANISM="Genus nov. species nov., Strain RCC2339" /LENGTH=209 /DNA_ID=CAMNT_0007120747 /DNA_START=93 /DNA_END=722 /DNA_ORIENTATION=+
MGISRDSVHKRRASSGRQISMRKKRKFESGRPAAMTRLGAKKVNPVRARGGNLKLRALRLDHGNFSWGSEAISKKTRIVSVVYNATNNELVRTNTLVKNCIVQIDSAPFRQWYQTHYGQDLGKKVKEDKEDKPEDEKASAKSKHVVRKIEKRNATKVLDPLVGDQFKSSRLYACISSRPGQSGRADGYILEGEELKFYLKKLQKKKGKK